MHRLALATMFVVLSVVAALAACSSTPGPSPDGGAHDAATADVTHEHESGAHDAGIGLVCGKLLTCDQACTSSACTNACYAESTGVAQGLFNAFTACLADQCPSTPGGQCASSSSSACSSCQRAAAISACYTKLSSCSHDEKVGPPDPDGGGVVAQDGGTELSCGEYIACEGACASGDDACKAKCTKQATSKAQSLETTLQKCLTKACTDDGGPCVKPGSACNGCVEQAEFSGTCGTPYNACVTDTSNEPDAGKPTALNGGTLSTVLEGKNQVGSSMIVKDGYLYFAQEGAKNQVSRFSLADGGGVAALGPTLPTPVGLAVDSNNVYTWNYGTFSPAKSVNNDDGVVVQIPLEGGAPVTIGTKIQVYYAAPYLNAITTDSTNVYWVNGASGSNGTIVATPIGTKSGAVIYSKQAFPEAIATDGVNVYWANWGTFDSSGNSNVDGTISQGPIGGGKAIVLAKDLAAPSCMVVDSTSVYWTNLGRLGGDNLPALDSGSVMQVPIGGGKVVTLSAKEDVPVGIALSGKTVYWTEYGLGAPGRVLSVPKGGGKVVPLVTGLENPYSLALSGTTMFWSYYMASTPSSPGNVLIEALSPF
jgi:hypothetical protein